MKELFLNFKGGIMAHDTESIFQDECGGHSKPSVQDQDNKYESILKIGSMMEVSRMALCRVRNSFFSESRRCVKCSLS